jgi:diacylglycerol diphosphate phosphatase/phosphatidate phosphatase
MLDYIALLITIALLLLSQRLTPFHQQIWLGDRNIQHPHATHERVPSSLLLTFGAAVPLGTIIVLFLLTQNGWNTLHVALLGLGLTITTTDFLTNLAKNAIGRPRPDLSARCMPKPFEPLDKWLDIGICQNPNQGELQDGWRSFPSGHSSFSFAGLGFLAFVLAGQLRAFRPGSNYLKVLAVLVPLCLAASVAISRLEDYRHDPYDVTAGSLLGLGVAYLNYRRYFPRLRDPKCDQTYKIGEDGLISRRTTQLSDEELGLNGHREEFELDDDVEHGVDSAEREPLSARA